MRHLSEFVSTPKELYKVGQTLPVNLYFYLPLNKTVVFFRRNGEVLNEEDIQKIHALPKNTLLIHRSEAGRVLRPVTENLSRNIAEGNLWSPEVRADAATLLRSIDPAGVPGEPPSKEVARQLLAEVPKLVETVIMKMERTPSVQVYEDVLRESKKKAQDPIEAHNAQVSSVAVLMLLNVAGDPVIGKGVKSTPDSLANLGAAGLVHDIGLRSAARAVIDRHLCGDDEELTVSEKLLFMHHVDETIKLLRSSGLGVSEEVLQAVEYHHENFNGTGFRGMVGAAIPFAARILRIADDIVTCLNNPKNLFGFRDALAHLAMRDRHLDSPIYDPDIMNALAAIEG